MRKETQNWIDTAAYDYETAGHMLQAGRYIYVIFMCHLAIEKMLKACIHESSGSLPPKSHELVQLAVQAGVTFPENLVEFVGRINNSSVPTRYPSELTQLVAAYPQEVAESYFERTGQVLAWLRQDKRLA